MLKVLLRLKDTRMVLNSSSSRDAVTVIQFNLRAFFSVRTWPWMMLFYKLRPLLRSAQVEKELAVLNEDFSKLKEAYDRCPHRLSFIQGLTLKTSRCLVWSPAVTWAFNYFFSVRSEGKRKEAEERQVVLVQEKNDLALQLQAVSPQEIQRNQSQI